MAAAEEPLGADEFGRLLLAFAPFESMPRLAVGVSGGPDSLALTLLLAAWASSCGGSVLGLIVDHGLRPGSGEEAERVAGWLAARGLPARILPWLGAKPASSIQAAAREARHGLLLAACREAGILHLCLGHQAGDLAETAAMRHERGSGEHGLAGIAAVREVPGLRILRPLLGIKRARLLATLRAAGQPWIEDASPNRRTQLRAEPGFDAGHWFEVATAAASRRQAAEIALAQAAARLVRPHPLGFLTLARDGLRGLEPTTASLLLARCIATVSGAGYPPSQARLAEPLARLQGEEAVALSLGGALLRAGQARIVLTREPGRIRDERRVAEGAVLWDGRFELACSLPEPLTLRALGPEGRSRLPASRGRLPAAAVEALPALWRGDELLACPSLGLTPPGGQVKARWLPRGALAPAPFGPIVVSKP